MRIRIEKRVDDVFLQGGHSAVEMTEDDMARQLWTELKAQGCVVQTKSDDTVTIAVTVYSGSPD